jgi:hypothetical protein
MCAPRANLDVFPAVIVRGPLMIRHSPRSSTKTSPPTELIGRTRVAVGDGLDCGSDNGSCSSAFRSRPFSGRALAIQQTLIARSWDRSDAEALLQ